MKNIPTAILLTCLSASGCLPTQDDDNPGSSSGSPDMHEAQDMDATLPDWTECAAQTSEKTCLAMGCTRWEVAYSVWTYSETNGCSLDVKDAGLCWVHPEGRRTTSHGESHYCQTNSNGTARIAYTRRDVGDVSGWSYCADDFISASGCPFNTP